MKRLLVLILVLSLLVLTGTLVSADGQALTSTHAAGGVITDVTKNQK